MPSTVIGRSILLCKLSTHQKNNPTVELLDTSNEKHVDKIFSLHALPMLTTPYSLDRYIHVSLIHLKDIIFDKNDCQAHFFLRRDSSNNSNHCLAKSCERYISGVVIAVLLWLMSNVWRSSNIGSNASYTCKYDIWEEESNGNFTRSCDNRW